MLSLNGEYWTLTQIAEAENVKRATASWWWAQQKFDGMMVDNSLVLVFGESYRAFSEERKRRNGGAK